MPISASPGFGKCSVVLKYITKETASVSDTVVNLSKISTAQARIDEATGEVNDASVVNTLFHTLSRFHRFSKEGREQISPPRQ